MTHLDRAQVLRKRLRRNIVSGLASEIWWENIQPVIYACPQYGFGFPIWHKIFNK
ncbi:hypothetical protein J6590_096451 [Homalodisca vitripennis]|nr:hypothetical protein J6590_096451 [Homalodisca vitripennis]